MRSTGSTQPSDRLSPAYFLARESSKSLVQLPTWTLKSWRPSPRPPAPERLRPERSLLYGVLAMIPIKIGMTLIRAMLQILRKELNGKYFRCWSNSSRECASIFVFQTSCPRDRGQGGYIGTLLSGGSTRFNSLQMRFNDAQLTTTLAMKQITKNT